MVTSTRRYHYECSNGHGLSAPTQQTACRVMLSPQPDAKRSTACKGTLKQLR